MRRCKGFYMAYDPQVHTDKKKNFDFGFFHQFAYRYVELGNGVGVMTTAIVELKDGRIVEAVVDSIQFLDR